MHCICTIEVTHADILAVADEEGSLRLLNINKSASQSLVKGTHVYIYNVYTSLKLLVYTDIHYHVSIVPRPFYCGGGKNSLGTTVDPCALFP